MLQRPDCLPDPGVPLSIPMEVSPPVAHRAWREARDRVLASVRAGEGLVLVLGLPGTGKTLLLRNVARTLGDAGYDVLLQSRGDIPIEAAEAGVSGPAGLRPRVVLIDEADRMGEAALERLGQLGARSFVLARLAGSGDDPDRLPVPAAVVRLEPLTPEEVGAFAAARLAGPGRRTLPLDERAVSRLAERSGGVPRVLDMLLSAATFLATTEDAARIEAAHIDRAAAMRDGDDAMPPEMDGAQQRGAEPESRAGAHPVRRPLSRGRAAALCAAVGIAALCGWLALRPGELAQRAQPSATLAGPDAAPPMPLATAAPQARRPEEAGLSAFKMLPAQAPAHVAIYYARGDAGAEARAADLARTLRAAGMAVGEPVATAPRAGKPEVRYFFAEDRQAAGTVLDRAGLSADDMAAGATRPGFLPRPGTIEVTVPSS